MEKNIRINKYLSAAGVCSRREADRQIAAGNVKIGERTAQIADLVSSEDSVYFQGRLVKAGQERILLVVNNRKGSYVPHRKKKKIISWIFYIIQRVFIRLGDWTNSPKDCF